MSGDKLNFVVMGLRGVEKCVRSLQKRHWLSTLYGQSHWSFWSETPVVLSDTRFVLKVILLFLWVPCVGPFNSLIYCGPFVGTCGSVLYKWCNLVLPVH